MMTAMVEMAIADNPAFQASRMEIDRGGTSYTVDTLTSLRDVYALTPAGEKQLEQEQESWVRLTTGVGRVLGHA